MQYWIKRLYSPPDEELFKLSLEIEPKLNDPWPVVQKLLNEKHCHLAEIRRLKKRLGIPLSDSTPTSPRTVNTLGTRRILTSSESQVQIGSPGRTPSPSPPNGSRLSKRFTRSISAPDTPPQEPL